MATDPIVLVGDLESYQGGDAQSLIDQATALVRSYCGWHVAPVITETLVLDGSGSATQMLPSLRVRGISTVTYDGVPLSPDEYDWSPVGYLTVPGRCSKRAGALSVTLTHGFDDAPDLAAVVMAVVSRAQASPNGVVRTQAGPFAETYSQTAFNVAGGVSLVAHEYSILDRYRLPPRP